MTSQRSAKLPGEPKAGLEKIARPRRPPQAGPRRSRPRRHRAGRGQARRAGLFRLSAAAGRSRLAADAGTRAGRARRHAAAIPGADHAEGLSGALGRRPRPRRAADAADRRRHHPEPGTRRRHQDDAASRARAGAAMDADAGAASRCWRRCRKHAIALERRLGAGLNPEAQATVRRWLARIAAELQQ